MVSTRSQQNSYQYHRQQLTRACRTTPKVPNGFQDSPDSEKIYVAKVLQNDHFLKLGASKNVPRRLTDRNFGKAPRRIARQVKDPKNRKCIGYFIAKPRAQLTGLQLERLFHSKKEEMKVSGEWYLSSDFDKINRFFKAYDHEFVSSSN